MAFSWIPGVFPGSYAGPGEEESPDTPGTQLYPHTNIHVARFGACRFGFTRFGFVVHDIEMDESDAFYNWCLDETKDNESVQLLEDISEWSSVRTVNGE